MIGTNINRIRKKKNLTLSELAERADISKSYLSNIERNLNDNPSIHIIEKLAEVLDVDMITLLDEEKTRMKDDLKWQRFICKFEELGITSSDFEEYRIVFEFIKWQSGQKEKK
ncbi:helix-turn-helix domain-containing protein [Gracilibacillus caseinilyticus]|uniref:Helix-turn-helix domain-containing protein n=1 Tax=Gracilibacillus caseinilyticus TaxID=2932256 RepID=A0ABY4EWZ0_9BACI|nr:helix-turn-helix transcriptional regulator [Gracilibacillus caseinilyticus]UOQ48470.1 helix-turn-helix domain-containing protein [Gracilibacillus caseinilyticus]